MFDLAFHKRFRSSYDISPSSSPPDLPLRNCYQGTSELVEDDEEEEDDEDEEDDEEEEEKRRDEDPAAGDEGLVAGDEGPSIGFESLNLGGDEAVPEGQQWAAPVVEKTVCEPLGLGYGALRRRETALGEGRMPSIFKVGQSSGSLLESERPKRVSALRQPTLTTWIDLEDGIAYIDVLAYPPPAPLALTLPSPE
ncbi:hypothetical protein Tco_1443599 [Tanacetum coccineum]